jgi:hypothetical protein
MIENRLFFYPKDVTIAVQKDFMPTADCDQWKVKCLAGEYVPDFVIEKDSTQCDYEPPSTLPPTPEPTPKPELPGLIGWEGDFPIADRRYVGQYYGQYVIFLINMKRSTFSFSSF